MLWDFFPSVRGEADREADGMGSESSGPQPAKIILQLRRSGSVLPVCHLGEMDRSPCASSGHEVCSETLLRVYFVRSLNSAKARH